MTDTLPRATSLRDQPRFDCRDAYVKTLSELADADHRIVGVVNDSVGSSKLDAFKKAFPDRLINVGIAEQDMVGVAAGLANGGRIPFVSAASCFLTARALEQIKADVAYSDRNVKLCGMSPGMAYGELGPTHQSIEDIAWLRAIDNITIIVPADPIETAAALRWAAAVEGPVFVRVSRMGVPQVNADDYEFVPGKAVTLREGGDVTLISNGTVIWRALVAAEILAEEGISARVLSMPTVKPLDVDAIVAAAQRDGRHRDGRGGHLGRKSWGGRGRDGGAASSDPGRHSWRPGVCSHRLGRVPPRSLRHVSGGHRRVRPHAGPPLADCSPPTATTPRGCNRLPTPPTSPRPTVTTTSRPRPTSSTGGSNDLACRVCACSGATHPALTRRRLTGRSKTSVGCFGAWGGLPDTRAFR